MKNIKFIFAALVSLAALSCDKESLPQSTSETNQEIDLVPLVLTTGEATKTYIAENGKDIYWHTGDKIKVYSDISMIGDKAQSYDFTMPDEFSPIGNYAKFEGKVVIGTNKVWAVYPSELSLGATDLGIIQVNLPSTQKPYNGETNSFDKNLNISAAKADVELKYETGDITNRRPTVTENMTFHNICALLKFTIPSNITNIKSIVISTDNNIAGDMTIDYSGDNPVFSGITSNGSKSITMSGTFTDNKDYYFVLAPVAISELSIFVNTTDNKQYAAAKTFTTPMQFAAGEYKNLGTLNVNNMPSFGVDYYIQDDGGFLNGTDVIFTFPCDDVSNINLTVSDKNGKAVRTINVANPELNESNQFISSCLNETVSTWPYLPKGTYSVSGTYTTDGGIATINDITFTVNTDPNFTVGSFEATTSYTKYVAGATSEANKLNGTSIYVEASKIGISDNIRKNSNYTNLFQIQFDTHPSGNYGSANLVDGLTAELTNQQHGEYKSPSYVFDEKSISYDITCHVTCIPYNLANDQTWINKPLSDGYISGNIKGNITWSGNSVMLGNNLSLNNIIGADLNTSAELYKNLYIPANMRVSITASGSVYSDSKTFGTTGSIIVGSTVVCEGTAKGKSSGFLGLGTEAQTVEISCTNKELSMTQGNTTVAFRNSYGAGNQYTQITKFELKYN